MRTTPAVTRRERRIGIVGANFTGTLLAVHLMRLAERPTRMATTGATPDGVVIGADGSATEGLYALGLVTSGTFWEITAVPELRV